MTKFNLLMLSLIFISAIASAADSDSALRKDLDEVSTKALRQKVIWNGDYTAFADSYEDYERTLDLRDSTWMRLRHRLRLGMKAEPNQYVRFTGRLAAYKNFLQMESTEGALCGTSSCTTPVVPVRTYYSMRPYNDAQLRIDRMYVDFFPGTKVVSGSFGLFPTTEGLPSDLQRMQPRKSTYANMLFNTGFAGVVGAFHPSELIPALPETHLWLIYTHAFEPAQKITGYINDDPTRFSNKSIVNQFVINLETRPKVSFAESLLVSAGYGLVKDYRVSDDAYQLYVMRTLGLSSTNIFTVNPGMKLGDIDKATLHIQAEHIMGTGFNFFVTGALTPMVNNYVKTTYEPSLTLHNAAAANGISDAGLPYEAYIGLQGSIHTENRWGKAIYTGVTYDSPRKLGGVFGAPSLGYEFHLTDRKYLGLYTSGEDITSRFENPGATHKFFYTQPVTNSLKLHFSYTYVLQRYNSGLFEWYVPKQGPVTVTPLGTQPQATNIDVNSVTRGGRDLHAFQLAAMFSF